MSLEQLKSADEAALRDINALLRQISGRLKDCSTELLDRIVRSLEAELWVVREDNTIVGMATLALVTRPEGIAARVEDVVIRDGERGKGYGTLLLKKLIERAKARGASVVQLTSNPSRTAANMLYKKLGFTFHETNAYYLRL